MTKKSNKSTWNQLAFLLEKMITKLINFVIQQVD